MSKSYPIPPCLTESTFGIERVKRLEIYVTTDDFAIENNDVENLPSIISSSPASRLRFRIRGHQAIDEDDEEGGALVTEEYPVDRLISDFVKSSNVSLLREPTPLDFALQCKCVVVLKLLGDFWEFSRKNPGITTKDEHTDSRYCGLKEYDYKNRIRAVSFCAAQPIKKKDDGPKNKRHGLNLFVDFLQTEPRKGKEVELRLPVIIDPDIENRGRP